MIHAQIEYLQQTPTDFRSSSNSSFCAKSQLEADIMSKITKVCDYCKEEFESYNSQKRQFCSHKCKCQAMIGKKNSLESRQKHSENLKKAWETGRFKGMISMKAWNSGKKTGKLSTEHRGKISVAHKKRFQNGAKPWFVGLPSEKHPCWKGGRYIHSNGYVLVHCSNHPRRMNMAYVYEHILVVEKHLGRYLRKGEIVHHIDFDVTNNNIDNLHLFETNVKHLEYHFFLRNCVREMLALIMKKRG